jgi:hypothetical protein
MEQALPPEQAYLIWCLSWLGLFVGLFGVLRGYPLIGALHVGGACTSLLYWSDPDMRSWRRWLDILWIQATLGSLLYLSRAAQYRYGFYGCVGLGGVLYGTGWLFLDSPWLAAFAHAGVHLCGNLGTVLLVSSDDAEDSFQRIAED